jgi:outer membrane protein
MKRALFILLFFGCSMAQAQNILSLNEVIQTALKKNYGIMISRNEANIDKANNTVGNAGMLPDILLGGSKNWIQKNAHQELWIGGVTDDSDASSSVFNTSIELTWTLFDGGKMFVTKGRLSEIEALGELQYREQVMQTVYNVVSAYFNIVKQKQQLNSIEQTISYNRERVMIMQTAFSSGSRGKTELLQAQIDLNVNLESAISQQSVIDDAKRELNRLLGEDAEQQIDAIDSIPLNYTPDRNKLQQRLFTSNPTVKSFQKQAEINRLMVKEIERARLPKINFNAGYYYNLTNPGGTVKLNRSYGPQAGLSFSLPVYQSGDINRQAKIARINLESASYKLEDFKLQLNTELQKALNQFENQQKLLQIETENAGLTKENLEISLQRLRLGQTNSLEVHLAQEEFVQSSTRLLNFQYNLKMAETRLTQLLGDL